MTDVPIKQSAHQASAAESAEFVLRERLKTFTGGIPLFVGICGSQGSGKSTLAAELACRLRASGLRVVILSIDDLYLSREARRELAASVHPLLATRGVPGTHDVDLGCRLFQKLRSHAAVVLPRFDKASDTAKPISQWEPVDGPVDVVLFEGWCVGARPQTEDALAVPVNALERMEDSDGAWRNWVNARLASDYQALFSEIDLLLLLAAPTFEVVAQWRLQQEDALRAELISRGEDILGTQDESQIARFVQHYQRITEHILREMPARADLTVRLNHHRIPIAFEFADAARAQEP